MNVAGRNKLPHIGTGLIRCAQVTFLLCHGGEIGRRHGLKINPRRVDRIADRFSPLLILLKDEHPLSRMSTVRIIRIEGTESRWNEPSEGAVAFKEWSENTLLGPDMRDQAKRGTGARPKWR